MFRLARFIRPNCSSFLIQKNSFALNQNFNLLTQRFCQTNAFNKSYETILIEKKDKIAIIRINRPKQRNALNTQVCLDITNAASILDNDAEIAAIVLTGNEQAFAAGADIKEMSELNYMDVYKNSMFVGWDSLNKVKKPIIGAVNGFALGGGCELAMMCDILVAGEGAQFGQPEITIGTIPGMGGTQRLTQAIGKSKAMEMALTGRRMSAAEAERLGLVARVVPDTEVVSTAVGIAEKIATFSKPIVALAKDCVNKSFEMTLQSGLEYERRLFYSSFSTNDKKEGMAAFVQKRPPNFTDN
eukprot:TRINITY_DN1233_c0_g1_i1.p1 TRINITY_DN1233_c0_g1~~TRINITY_DN1233_c0_g1_i1.p1  ORF type:complete len:300 (+),score=151.13 TRINITY_DN1233_c0_g1_i1:112-1011(+)